MSRLNLLRNETDSWKESEKVWSNRDQVFNNEWFYKFINATNCNIIDRNSLSNHIMIVYSLVRFKLIFPWGGQSLGEVFFLMMQYRGTSQQVIFHFSTKLLYIPLHFYCFLVIYAVNFKIFMNKSNYSHVFNGNSVNKCRANFGDPLQRTFSTGLPHVTNREVTAAEIQNQKFVEWV